MAPTGHNPSRCCWLLCLILLLAFSPLCLHCACTALHFSFVCCASLRFALRCVALHLVVLCCVALCYVALCCVVLICVICVVLCCVVLRCVVWCYVTLRCVVFRCVALLPSPPFLSLFFPCLPSSFQLSCPSYSLLSSFPFSSLGFFPLLHFPVNPQSTFDGIACLSRQSKFFKDQFVPPYAPVFTDGWVPPGVVAGKDVSNLSAAVAANAAAVAQLKDVQWKVSRNKNCLLTTHVIRVSDLVDLWVMGHVI